MLEFVIEKQRLRRIDRDVVISGSENYLYAHFSFSDDWEDTTRNVIFEKEGKLYPVVISQDDICEVPTSCLNSKSLIKMSVVGSRGITKITTNLIRIEVREGGTNLAQSYSDIRSSNIRINEQGELVVDENVGLSINEKGELIYGD